MSSVVPSGNSLENIASQIKTTESASDVKTVLLDQSVLKNRDIGCRGYRVMTHKKARTKAGFNLV